MKKLLAILAMSSLFSFPVSATSGGDECQVTDELKISGAVNAQGNVAMLHGKLYNTSTYMEYKNVLVQAELCDANGNTVGLQTISIEDDVEKGETEQFEMEIRPLAQVTSVEYKVICAERDFAGLGY